MYLAMHLFPTFVDIFQRLREGAPPPRNVARNLGGPGSNPRCAAPTAAADREFATQCLKHYLESVMGPPNHPTYREDRAGAAPPSPSSPSPLLYTGQGFMPPYKQYASPWGTIYSPWSAGLRLGRGQICLGRLSCACKKPPDAMAR
jgi:hypothetical protein